MASEGRIPTIMGNHYSTGNPQLHIEKSPFGWKISDGAGKLVETPDWSLVAAYLAHEVGPNNTQRGSLRSHLGMGNIGAFAPAPKAQQKTTATSLPLTLEDLGL